MLRFLLSTTCEHTPNCECNLFTRHMAMGWHSALSRVQPNQSRSAMILNQLYLQDMGYVFSPDYQALCAPVQSEAFDHPTCVFLSRWTCTLISVARSNLNKAIRNFEITAPTPPPPRSFNIPMLPRTLKRISAGQMTDYFF